MVKINQPAKSLSQSIKQKAQGLGFLDCGIARADILDEPASLLKQWIKAGFHADMKYMENHFEKRIDPRQLVPSAKSVISVIKNYYTSEEGSPQSYKISSYALGKDYHKVVKDKLYLLLNHIQKRVTAQNARVFVDSAPVMDKVWAEKAGLGWIGKNTCLINRKWGSFTFIGSIILDVELAYDTEKQKDLCGSCNRCIRACPTGALVRPYVLDARKCISYHTIENKGPLPGSLKNKFDDWIFGCDICQRVCPWNRSAIEHDEGAFIPSDDLLQMTRTDWENLSEDRYKLLFKDSAVIRTTFKGLKRNISFCKTGNESPQVMH